MATEVHPLKPHGVEVLSSKLATVPPETIRLTIRGENVRGELVLDIPGIPMNNPKVLRLFIEHFIENFMTEGTE